VGKILAMISRMYYDPSKRAFSTQQKLQNAIGQSTSKQKQSRKQILRRGFQNKLRTHYVQQGENDFPGTPTLNNINDVRECDLMDVQDLSKYNDGVKYLLTVIYVFSKFLHIIPLISKMGKAVTSAFQSTLKDPKYLKPIRRRPVWVRTERERILEQVVSRHVKTLGNSISNL
jgi:hypothetical protein